MNKEAQANIRKIQRDFNPAKDVQAFNFKYSNLNTILPELNKLCEQHKIEYTLVQTGTDLISKDIFEVIEKGVKKTKVSVSLNTHWEFWITDMEEPMKISVVGIGTQADGDRALGSAITYARRYLLLNLFNANDGGATDPEQNAKHDNDRTYQKPASKQYSSTPKKFSSQPSDEEMANIMLGQQGK